MTKNSGTAQVNYDEMQFPQDGIVKLELLDRTSAKIKLITEKPQGNPKLKDGRELKDFLEKKFFIGIEQCTCITYGEKTTCYLKLKNGGWAYYDGNEIIK